MFDFDPNNRRFAEDLSEQEVFDLCVMHLGTMPHRSTDPRNFFSCVYRAEDGNKCALGFFISDREYVPEFEGCSILSLVEPKYNFPKRLLKHESLFYQLQSTHDQEDYWEDDRIKMKYRLEEIARDGKLSEKVLSNPNLAWNK